jgi:DNA repair exonuclease SbcCD ATPase subunit
MCQSLRAMWEVVACGGSTIMQSERSCSMTHARYLPLFAAAMIAGCSSVYYGTLETFGVHKRDVLVDRVEDARDDQEEAKEDFRSALEKFAEVVNVQGGDLEAKYKQLNAEYERCESAASRVRNRIESIEDVAEALFDEWEAELEQYSSRELRSASERQLDDTRDRYRQLIGAMKRAEAKMEPVLVAFHDRVLFLKHNLNAQAIASLQGEVVSLEQDVARLIADMEASIAEANAFIDSMSG